MHLKHPDHDEPTANRVILVACLLTFAAAMGWASSRLHPAAQPKDLAVAVSHDGARESGSASGLGDAPGNP
jgi:hypothetical protein